MKRIIRNIRKIIIVVITISIINFCFNFLQIVNANNLKWNLYFDNINITEGSVNAITVPTITDSSKTEITYSVNLNMPGEFYEFTVDVKNAGTLDAMVSEINGNELTERQKRFLLYEVTYLDGTEVKKNDKLKSGATETLRIRLEFKKDITAEDLPSETTTLTLSINTCYVQADDNAVEREETNTNSADNSNSSNSSENEKETEIEAEIEAENETGRNNISISKNAKTGDNIIIYFIILALAILALVITKIVNKKEDK